MGRKSLFSRLLFAEQGLLSGFLEFLFELLNSPSGIEDLLCPCVERMTCGADARGDFRRSRAGGPFVSACAFYLGIRIILWVYILFHFITCSPSANLR